MQRENKGPHATCDVIIEVPTPDGPGVVLVKRRHPPLGWALPGGFVEAGESTFTAAAREAQEETGLAVTLKELFGVYSDPKRDPRGLHTLTVVYIGTADGTPQGADDAEEARAFPLSALPSPLAFDHGDILAHYRRYRADGTRPPIDR
jgi:8-oxo-dGTP diphosphatase